jgi:phasin family protein
MFLNTLSLSSGHSSLRRCEPSLQAAFDCVNEVVAGFERVVELNVQTVKTSLAEHRALVDAALSARSFSEAIDLHSQQMPAAVKKTFAYWRHVEDISVTTQSGVFAALRDLSGGALQTFGQFADFAARRSVGDERPDRTGVVLIGQPASGDDDAPVAIVDSSGKVVSSDGEQRNLR